MKFIFRHFLLSTIIGFLIGCTTIGPVRNGPIVGAWGGKWDDRWPVFFVIIDTGEPTYKVFYKWKERIDGPFSLSEGTARGSVSELQFDNINILVDARNSDRAVARGDFPTPLKANLKRLPPTTIEKLDIKDIN